MEQVVPNNTSVIGANLNSRIILRAGAGAGKTTTLIDSFIEYARLFKQTHGRYPKIILTTYTRKATQEIKERLLTKALELEDQELFKYISQKSKVHISTIHGVLSIYLSKYGNKLSLSPEFQILNDNTAKIEARKILRSLILSNEDYYQLLNYYEFSQVENALYSFYEKSFYYDQASYISIDEIKVKIEKEILDVLSISNDLSQSILTQTEQKSWVQYATGLQRLNAISKITDISAIQKELEIFKELNPRIPSWKSDKPAVAYQTKEQLDLFNEKIKNLMNNPAMNLDYLVLHEELNSIFYKLFLEFKSKLLQTKCDSGILTMSDLETLAIKLVKEYPFTASQFANEWDFWMIDEFQDTSPMQVYLLDSLIQERPYFIVGDPQQSIYLFRGARSEVFSKREDLIKNTNGLVLQKMTNYRSQPRLLEFFNYYFTTTSRQFLPMNVDPNKNYGNILDQAIEVLIAESDSSNTQDLNTQDESNSYEKTASPGVREESSPEAKAVLFRIQELLCQNISHEKICVLARTNDLLEQVARLAFKFNVPVQVHSSGQFFERPEVQDILTTLKFLTNPHDNYNFLSLLRSPWLRLSDSEIVSFCHSGSQSFWSMALKKIDLKNVSSSHPLRVLNDLLIKCEALGIIESLKLFLIQSGFIDFNFNIDPSGRREANVWKVINLLSQELRKHGFNILEFIDQGIQSMESESNDGDATPAIEPKRVQLMTVHASKGLQFEQVIVMGLAQDPRPARSELFSLDEESLKWSLSLLDSETQVLVPSLLAKEIQQKKSQKELLEHERVFYVAMTRAKNGITLVWNEKVGKKSWASQWPLQSVAGDYEEDQFAYRVRKATFGPVMIESPLNHKHELKSKYTQMQLDVIESKESVTGQISEQFVKSENKQKIIKTIFKANQGTQSHKIFESLKYLSRDEIMELGLSEKDQKAIDFICNNKELFNLIQSGYVEWGFTLKNQNVLRQGQIDLWGKFTEDYYIIDYKTGSQEFYSQAIEQLKSYADSLKLMQQIPSEKKVHLWVVYAYDEKIKKETY